MHICWDDLVRLVGAAFDKGYEGSFEEREATIRELLHSFGLHGQEFRVWSLAELQKMAEGSIFEHIQSGRCWLVNGRTGKYMRFQTGLGVVLEHGGPWQYPMRLIYDARTGETSVTYF